MTVASDMIVALPIKGESFLLRKGRWTVLVDGGWSGDKVGNVISTHFQDIERLNIVVCTHEDKDHAGGLPDILNQWAERIDQLWLPGRWVDVIPKLVMHPQEFLDQLSKELDNVLEDTPEEIEIIISDKDATNQDSAKRDNFEQENITEIKKPDLFSDDEFNDSEFNPDSLREPEWFISLRSKKDDIVPSDDAKTIFRSTHNRILRRRRKLSEDKKKKIHSYWIKLIEAAERIRNIAISAINHDIKIRWFGFSDFMKTGIASGGIPGFLIPLNSIEQTRPPMTNLYYYSSLTTANEQSLVFMAPRTLGSFGVLFCGDSPLGTGPGYRHSFLPSFDPLSRPLIVTTPHHGSESNRIAYQHLEEWRPSIFLRAGGDRDHPGHSFLHLESATRLCAKCPRKNLSPITSGVMRLNGWPRFILIGRICSC